MNTIKLEVGKFYKYIHDKETYAEVIYYDLMWDRYVVACRNYLDHDIDCEFEWYKIDGSGDHDEVRYYISEEIPNPRKENNND